jgi:hypothetical protein
VCGKCFWSAMRLRIALMTSISLRYTNFNFRIAGCCSPPRRVFVFNAGTTVLPQSALWCQHFVRSPILTANGHDQVRKFRL